MTRRSTRIAAQAVLAGVAVSAFALLGAAPAGAHTDNLYTFQYRVDTPTFATIGKTDGVVVPLATPAGDDLDMVGIKVANEVGSAIGVLYGDPDTFYVLNWDHSTGAPTTPIPAFVAGADEEVGLQVSGLDRLADGTLITYVEYSTTTTVEIPTTTEHAAIASVNTTTGELTPILDLSSLTEGDDHIQELATDPISGDTYAFIYRNNVDAPYYARVDFASGLGTVTQFAGANFEDGVIGGADFDASGTLYFIYENNFAEELELSSLGSPSTWPTAARTNIAPATSAVEGQPLSELALTVEVAAPALAKTGAPEISPAWGAAAGALVLGGAVLLVGAARRRKRA